MAYDRAEAARYAVEYGQSPQAEAARVLRDFMCCQAGRDLVEHGILRPFGYTLDPGPVVAENRELRDRVERLELRLADRTEGLIAPADLHLDNHAMNKAAALWSQPMMFTNGARSYDAQRADRVVAAILQAIADAE